MRGCLKRAVCRVYFCDPDALRPIIHILLLELERLYDTGATSLPPLSANKQHCTTTATVSRTTYLLLLSSI
jgi:hypothetical protein